MSENTPGGSVPPQNEPPVPPPPATTPPPAAPTPPPSAPVPPPAPPAGYGAPPPPAGYGPPPAGYAAPPPPAGYGPPPPTGGPNTTDDVIESVKYGWKKFTENVGPFVLGGLAWFIGLSIVIGIAYGILIASAIAGSDSSGNLGVAGGIGFGFGTFLFVAVVVLAAVLVQAAYLNVALRVSAGQPIQVADFFRLPNLGKVIPTALLVGLATGIGYALFVIPGIIVAFFATFAIAFALDRGLGAVDAIKASVDLVKNNVVPVILLVLAVYVVNAIGGALCGVGVLASYPVAYVAVAFMYRRLQNQPVAP